MPADRRDVRCIDVMYKNVCFETTWPKARDLA
jgi:hypothetical protein